MEQEDLMPHTPKFFELLSKEDKEKYRQIQATLSSGQCRNCRNRSTPNFSDMLNTLKEFCVQGDNDDWKRCIVCGLIWSPQCLAVNNRQLFILMGKCKSSINGSLQKIGYTAVQSKEEAKKFICQSIPFLRNNYTDQREWTLRVLDCKPQNAPNPINQTPSQIATPMCSPVPAAPAAPIQGSCMPYIPPYNPVYYPPYGAYPATPQPAPMPFYQVQHPPVQFISPTPVMYQPPPIVPLENKVPMPQTDFNEMVELVPSFFYSA